jgi:Na+-transporting NADH:ubiquinone oxidoreductase subunit NqrF
LPLDARQDVEAIEIGHYDVEHSHVRYELLDCGCRVSAVTTSRHNIDVRLSPQNLRNAAQYNRMVIRNDDENLLNTRFLV